MYPSIAYLLSVMCQEQFLIWCYEQMFSLKKSVTLLLNDLVLNWFFSSTSYYSLVEKKTF